jgi:hypothetical protein
MRKYILILCIPLLAILSNSCTKVVDINLNDADPKIIIEGSITDQVGSCMVTLTKSVNYSEPNTFPAVTGAIVTIADNSGNLSTLTETAAGVYMDTSFQGVVGRTYVLSVITEGQTYTATSTMPDPVNIDTLVQDSISYGGFGGDGETTYKFVYAIFHDPSGTNNYYRFVEVINKMATTDIHISDDELSDGNLITRSIYQRDTTLFVGDSVTIWLQSIDKNVYTYFDMLDQLTGFSFGGSATPANPTSNFNNGALGYFSACAVRSKTIVIK